MRTSKLKNLVLLILILCNAALLVLVVPTQLSQKRQAQRTAQELRSLFAGYDIRLPAGDLPETLTLYPLEATLDPEAALRAARAILGAEPEAVTETGSYAMLYAASSGTCALRRERLEATLEDRSLSGSGERAVARLLEDMGLSAHVISSEEGAYTARQSLLGAPVFSADLTFTLWGSRLEAVSGSFCAVEDTLTALSRESCISCSDALVAFLAARDSTGWVGASIARMEQGYLLADSASASKLRLNPVWRLETDTGVYYVNGLTREVFQEG